MVNVPLQIKDKQIIRCKRGAVKNVISSPALLVRTPPILE